MVVNELVQALLNLMINLLLVIVVALTPMIVVEVRRWIVAKRDEILSRVDDRTEELLSSIVSIVVRSVEQDARTKAALDNVIWTANRKKDEAIERMTVILASHGLVLDLREISARIEAAIHEGIHKQS
jgi:hypothetical protein